MLVDTPIHIGRAPRVLPDSAYLAARPPRYALETTTVLKKPLDEVFPFFAAAENLAAITPPDMGFEITSPTPIPMAEGTLIDYRIRVARIPILWRTRIDVWEPQARFVDSQLEGPYACWWHEHRFAASGSETVMTDLVLYAPPLGALGRVAQRLFVARELRRIFAYRALAIGARF